jgi:hypothetical protein
MVKSLSWSSRGRRSGDCVRPPSLAYALVIGDTGGAVVAGTNAPHVGSEVDAVTMDGTLTAAGRAGRARERSAVGNADAI